MVSAADPLGRNLAFLYRTSLEHLHKVLYYITRTKYFTRTLAQSTSLETITISDIIYSPVF
jgi:hypothetical protein